VKGFGRRNLGDGGGFIWPINIFPGDYMDSNVYMQIVPISENSGGIFPSEDLVDVWPFILPKIVRIKAINFFFSAIGPATYLRICIYGNKGPGQLYPGDLLWYGQEWDLSMTGQNPWRSEILGTPILLPGQKVLWAGYVSTGGNGNIISNSGQIHHIFGKTAPGEYSPARIMRATSTYGIPPDPYPAGGYESTTSGVGIQIGL
jgi:hypothetical protein